MMSHFSTFKIKLAGVTLAMLQAAIAKVAAEFNLKICNKIDDYYGHKHEVQVGLTGTGLGYGMGFSVDAKGEVTVHGDSYRSPQWTEISNRATQHMTAQKIAANVRMQHAGARINIQVKEKNVLVEACY
jgi:hypothetical protein